MNDRSASFDIPNTYDGTSSYDCHINYLCNNRLFKNIFFTLKNENIEIHIMWFIIIITIGLLFSLMIGSIGNNNETMRFINHNP